MCIQNTLDRVYFVYTVVMLISKRLKYKKMLLRICEKPKLFWTEKLSKKMEDGRSDRNESPFAKATEGQVANFLMVNNE